MDILAERVSDDARVRAKLKALYLRTAQVRTRAAKEEDSVYRMYYEHQETMRLMASHRVLAVNRGEAEGFLKVSLEVDAQQAENEVCALYVRPGQHHHAAGGGGRAGRLQPPDRPLFGK